MSRADLEAQLAERLDAITEPRNVLLREDERVKPQVDALGIRTRTKLADAVYEADPAWRQARDRYAAAVASAERLWWRLHPGPGLHYGDEA